MATFHDSAKSGTDNSSGTSTPTADTLAVTAGDLIYVVCKWEGANGAVASVTDGVDTYAEVTPVQNHTNNDLHLRTFSTLATTTGTRTITFALDAARPYRRCSAISYTPAATKSFALDAIATPPATPNNTAAVSAGSASATDAGCAIASFGLYGDRTLTVGSGWTLPAELDNTMAIMEHRAVTGAGSITGDGTFSGGVEWLAHLAIFKETGGGTTQDLAGAAAGQATATGAAAVGKPLGGAATGVAAATANLAKTATLAGSAQGQVSATGQLQGGATITTPPLKNNTGTVLASEAGATVHVYTLAGALVVTKTGQTTNGSGVMAINDALLNGGTTYRVVFVLASGAEGMDKLAAA